MNFTFTRISPNVLNHAGTLNLEIAPICCILLWAKVARQKHTIAPSYEQNTRKLGEIHGTVNLGFKRPVHKGYMGALERWQWLEPASGQLVDVLGGVAGVLPFVAAAWGVVDAAFGFFVVVAAGAAWAAAAASVRAEAAGPVCLVSLPSRGEGC